MFDVGVVELGEIGIEFVGKSAIEEKLFYQVSSTTNRRTKA